MRIIITGSRGLVGSNLYSYLLKNVQYNIYGIDRIYNKLYVQECFDITDFNRLNQVFIDFKPNLVIHLAANIAVGESEINPDKYYRDNLVATINVLSAMQQFNCTKLIFASTAAVYQSQDKPLTEQDALAPESVYGRTKLLSEQIIKDYTQKYNWQTIIFRFFNVAGGVDNHPEQLHLIPIVLDNIKNGKSIKIFGTDWDTPDGTCIRDYIHISDLIQAIEIAIHKLNDLNNYYFNIYNLGSEKGNSVNEIVIACLQIANKVALVEEVERRAGDLAICLADANKAHTELGWKSTKNITDIITDTWNMLNTNDNNDI